METTDILKILNGAGFVAVPAITALTGLDWYFTKGGKNSNKIFIAVAGLLSAVLYSYLVWTEPSLLLIKTSIGWYFGIATLAVVAYYGLYSAYNGSADPPAPRWLLPVALLSYIFLLSAIGIFCAAALARHDYLRLGGHVVGADKPLSGATVILQDANYAPLRQTSSNIRGEFLLALKYSDYEKKDADEKPAHLQVKAKGFSEQSVDLEGHPDERLTLAVSPK
jgi:hypothetical protein